MTIQRQYNLPSCTLTLEGLGETKVTNPAETRPLMLVLLNVYCKIVGQDPPLTGGREFLESLITEVSQYTQRLLSGVNPHHTGNQSSLVQLQPVDGAHHRLKVRNGEGPEARERSLDLTTVQLFDLVEALDQMLADRQTLPNLSLSLQPLSRRHVRTSEPLVKQAIPAALGFSGLAAASLLLALLPAPKVQQPRCLFPTPECRAEGAKEEENQPPTATTSPSPSPGASPTSTPEATNSSPAPLNSPSPEATTTPANSTASPSSSATQVETLRQQLQQELAKSWKGQNVSEDLIYRVSVSEQGVVRGYKEVNDKALTNMQLTPLPSLLKVPQPGEAANPEALVDFKVVFTPTGLVEVAPWQQAMVPPPNENPEITNSDQLEKLLPKLRSQLRDNWPNKDPKFVKPLEFQVRVTADGTIDAYRPYNQPAFDYEAETPLPKIAQKFKGEIPPTQQAHALFRVVFTERGTIELTPWRGWRNE
jgi:hypothetical protein